MEEQFRDLKISTGFPCEMTAKETENGVIELSIRWEGHPDGDGLLRVDWELPLVDMQFSWNPDCRFDRAIHPEWDTPTESMISSSAPVWSYYNASGINRLTFALSDAKTRIKVQAGVKEKGTLLIVRMSIPIDLYDRSRTYRVCLYRDTESVSFAEVLRRVTAWWENSCGMKPMPVPDAAKEPLYSCWYSYHQTFKADEVEAECALAAQCGMNTVIVDDGWQTEDDKGGYAYCGDWEVAPEKIPDMKQHVAKVHAAGLKYMLWYSVPFVGRKSRHWEEFKDKILGVRTWWDTGILDPRYPSVREFIIQNYAAAIKNWDLDGLKLDFIDSFAYTPDAETDTRNGLYLRGGGGRAADDGCHEDAAGNQTRHHDRIPSALYRTGHADLRQYVPSAGLPRRPAQQPGRFHRSAPDFRKYRHPFRYADLEQ